jgi:HlyD family secretion protein
VSFGEAMSAAVSRAKRVAGVSNLVAARPRLIPRIAAALAIAALPTACNRSESPRVQGYVEGEYVYVGAPSAGQLEVLHVQRGRQVNAGDALFAFESAREKQARDEAAQRLAQARSALEDARKGRRPTEIEAIEAQLNQARAEQDFSQKEYEREEKLVAGGATTAESLDRARSARDRDRQRVAQLTADLATARLGAREDQVAAAEADVRAFEAALAQAQWQLDQRRQAAPQAGLVFDTLYREGEWVAAGRPVVALLPPASIKVRLFVPETRVGALHPGDSARVFVDGAPEPFAGRISFISPQAEYTPPVIFSQESRSKLVFMIELTFDPKVGANLHPGQPVDAEFGP